MWPGFDPTPYTRDEYAAHVKSLPAIPWVRFIVLHNTASPTLAQWLDGGVDERERLRNLEHYYEVTQHWHAGPHGFITPTHICGFSDPTKPGVHCSCNNKISLGFEMVGDYSVEAFDDGPGAEVRDNAVFALALWHRKLGLRPDGYLYGVRGLHFHKDCLRDHHDCPGKHVDRKDMVERILAEMERQGAPVAVEAPAVVVEAERAGPPTPRPAPPVVQEATRPAPAPQATPAPIAAPPPAPKPPLPVHGVRDVAWFQQSLNDLNLAKIKVDGKPGPWTQMATRAFQASRSLAQTGTLDPPTIRAMEAALGFQQPAGAMTDTAGQST